ncbi:MAG: glutathione synthase/RimK-type ligase-like ATP-grasp enzyme [Bacteriovoracaceae bacterium]|jgi:glutathione synthase/RimK-type ligase-like ATP-grasp enzyme
MKNITPKRITLLTSKELEGYTHDDHLLINELINRGFLVQSKPWETFEDEGEDLFIIRTTWNYTEHFDEFIQCLEKIKDRLWNPLPLVKWNSNKMYLVEFFKKGLGVMPLYLARDEESLKNCLDELGGEEFVAKPPVSASAKGLIRFNRSNPPLIYKEMLIQRFYPEILEGEISLIHFNRKFAYAVKKIPKNGDFRVQEEHGGTVIPYTPTKEELILAMEVLKEVPGECLYARVDIVPNIGVIELECIEPSLFFGRCENGAKFFVDEISNLL